MTANCSATARSAGARLEDRPTEANSLEPPLTERRLGVTPPTRQTLPDAALSSSTLHIRIFVTFRKADS
jgi:hypothetical protein